MSENPAGWYTDPAEPTTQRYWDGDGWVGASLPIDATPPDGPLQSTVTLPPPATPPAGAPPAGVPGQAAFPGAGGYPPQPVYPPAIYPRPGDASRPPAGPGLPPGAFPPGSLPSGGRPGVFPPGTPPPGWPAGVPFPGGLIIDIRPHGFALAPLGRRLVARLIDIGVVLVLGGIASSLLLYQFIREVAPYYSAVVKALSSSNPAAAQNLPTTSSRASTLSLIITLILMAVWVAYEVPFIAAGGQTLGKRIMGIRVVPLEGLHPVGFARALRRWSTLGLPTLLWTCLGVGFILQFIGSLSPVLNRPLHLAMHDRAAATIVVSTAGRIEPSPSPVDPEAAATGKPAPGNSKTPNGGRR